MIQKKKKKKTKRLYFTQIHEDAIIEYCKTQDQRRKEVLYKDLIQPALDEMVDKIVFTYKFTTLPNIDFLREECKSWLVTILDKYDQSKGSKAFSYFSVITKNWFIHKVKKTTKRMKTETPLADMTRVESAVIVENEVDDKREHAEFFLYLNGQLDNWLEEADRPNDIKLLKAIKMLFEHSEQIEIFNKKAIYLYMREITDLNTKQIASSLSRFKIKYREFRRSWDDGEI
mgnify:CR=1 FL=1|tara:strand:+ start:6537 stop:7226 length:690 start_codon:yes stop_codon:yes gene_type:complete